MTGASLTRLSRGLLPINRAKIGEKVNTSTRRNHFLKKTSISLQIKSQKRRAYGMDNRFTDLD
jgi:hypothetical protein